MKPEDKDVAVIGEEIKGPFEWTGRGYDTDGGVLTLEMLEAAAAKAIREGGNYCQGHMVTPQAMQKGQGFCVQCGAFLNLTGK